MQLLSKEELMNYLYSLRKALTEIDYRLLTKVIFINQYSLYYYYSIIKCNLNYKYELTVGEVMEIIEPCIPFALTQATLDYFLSASLAATEKEMAEMEKKFNISAKLDFINVIRNIQYDEDWHYLLNICESLRQNNDYAVQYAK